MELQNRYARNFKLGRHDKVYIDFSNSTEEDAEEQICYRDNICGDPARDPEDADKYMEFVGYETCCGVHGGAAFGLHKRNCRSCPNEGVFTNKPISKFLTRIILYSINRSESLAREFTHPFSYEVNNHLK